MSNLQINAFLRSTPPEQRQLWQRFISSLNETQLSLFVELCPDITIKKKDTKLLASDGLGQDLASRVVDIKLVQRKHIMIEGDDKPFPAIVYRQHTYSLFRTLQDWAEVEKITSRLRLGYLVTQTPKGWVIWVHEP
jgi:hypothetical protein